MEEIDLKELLDMFLEKKFLIIIVVIIATILGVIYTTKILVPEYQSSTSLVLVQVGGENLEDTNSITTTDITLNSNLVDDYREIAKSKSVATKVISNLNLDMSLQDVQESIEVASISDTELIQITVTHTNPETACRIANEVAKVFIEKVDEIYKVSNVHVLDEAQVSNIPSNVNLIKNIIIFAFIGFILVSAYILLINMLDTTVKTDTDIEKALHVPVLASIVLTDEDVRKKSMSANLKSKETEKNIQISYNPTIIAPHSAENTSEYEKSTSSIKNNTIVHKNNKRNRNKSRRGGRK